MYKLAVGLLVMTGALHPGPPRKWPLKQRDSQLQKWMQHIKACNRSMSTI